MNSRSTWLFKLNMQRVIVFTLKYIYLLVSENNNEHFVQKGDRVVNL